MNVDEIEIHTGQPDFEFTIIRSLEVKCEATNALMPAPTIAEANGRLRALAAKVDANAIINVAYNSGVSFTSWKSLKATGTAVRRISDERICPFCAETVKRAAMVCKHCGADLRDHPPEPLTVPAEASTSTSAVPPTAEPLKDNNNPAIIVGLVGLGLFIVILLMSF